jgi:hypothetical protein
VKHISYSFLEQVTQCYFLHLLRDNVYMNNLRTVVKLDIKIWIKQYNLFCSMQFVGKSNIYLDTSIFSGL